MEPPQEATDQSEQPEQAQTERPSSKWWIRWWVHVLVLGSYPLVLGVMGADRTLAPGETMLPKGSGNLLILMGFTLLQFGVFLGVAWLFSRATSEQMLMDWRCGIAPVWRGFVYSIAMRFVIMVVSFLVIVIVLIIQGTSAIQALRPSTTNVVNSEALTSDPIYMVLSVTLLSFVVAGLREELWRSCVMGGLWVLYPRLGRTLGGQVLTVSVLALIFGLGHLPQGWLGVAQTTFLGLCLGAIIVYHRSVWEAVLAHGFFDDRNITYDFGELDEISLAYAISIHKSQGSEFPAVVIPLATQHYLLLQRNLIYTGVTRGRRLVVLIGQPKALAIAVRNQKTDERCSGLLPRLQEPR